MTLVKICGITNIEDALCAVDASADLLGFIFYPPSPRSVTMEVAKEIVRAVKRATHLGGASHITLVGVFVKESPAHLLHMLADVDLDAAQLHGNDPSDLREMQGRAYLAMKEWKSEISAQINPQSEIRNQKSEIRNLPDLLLDANHPTLWGGSGERADESLAAQIARQHRLLLAGGLTPDNVADAIRAVKPWGVDVASGTEASPGKKDPAKVRAFIENAKRSF